MSNKLHIFCYFIYFIDIKRRERLVDFKDLMANQEKIRKKAQDRYFNKPRSYAELGKKIGINAMTVRGFLNGKSVNFITLKKIYDWLQKDDK